MAGFEDFTFPSSTGIHIVRARVCRPDGKVRGVVQITHGIAEHIERYDAFMSFLASNGFVSAGIDLPGHGRSSRDNTEKGFFAKKDGWNRVVDDMHTLYLKMHAEYPDVPYILFGHSMGSFLTRTYIIRYPDDHDLVILSGTGHQSRALILGGCIAADMMCALNGADAWGEALNRIAFGSYLDRIKDPRTPFDWLSRDEEAVDRYIADENCGFTAKNGLYRDMLHGISFITDARNIARMNPDKPVLFLSGAEDPVGEYGAGVERAYNAFRRALCKDVMMKLYPGGRHEMLNETNRDEVFQDILNWINSRIGP